MAKKKGENDKSIEELSKRLKALEEDKSQALSRAGEDLKAGKGLKQATQTFKDISQAEQITKTGYKTSKGSVLREAGFGGLGNVVQSLFDVKASDEEIKKAREDLGLPDPEEEKKLQIQASKELKEKIDKIAESVEYIRKRVSPKTFVAGKGDKRQSYQFDPLAPAGEQVRGFTSKGKLSTLKAEKNAQRSVIMQAALAGSPDKLMQSATPTPTGQVKKFVDPTETKAFDEGGDLANALSADTDPINLLRKDMKENFDKVFKLLEDKETDGNAEILSQIGNLARILGPIASTVGRVLGPAIGVGLAAYVGYEIGTYLNETLGLSDKINNLLEKVGLGPSGKTKESEAAIKDMEKTREAARRKRADEGNAKLAGTGYLTDGVRYKTPDGKLVTFQQLPKEIQQKLKEKQPEAAAAAPQEVRPDAAAPPGQVAAPAETPTEPPTAAPAPPDASLLPQPPAAAPPAPSPAPAESVTPTGKIAGVPTEAPAPVPVSKPAVPAGGTQQAAPAKKIGASTGKSAVVKALDKKKITNKVQRAAILAQVAHESGGFKTLSENLNYKTPSRLKQIFGFYKKNPAQAEADAGNPVEIANKVYSNRMGNGSPASGDGYKYRGRGFIQLTGRSNYNRFGVTNPDQLLNPETAAENAVDYMLGYKGDWNNVTAVTKYVNGGTHGLAERKGYFDSFLNDESAVAPETTQNAAPSTAAAAPSTSAPASTGTVAVSPQGISGIAQTMAGVTPTASKTGAEIDSGSIAMQDSKTAAAAPVAAGPTIINNNQSAPQVKPTGNKLPDASVRAAESAFARAISKDFSHPSAFSSASVM